MPTDTLYGLAALPTRREAVLRLFELKGRPAGKPISLLFPSLETVFELVMVTPAAIDLAHRRWPGPFTMILTAAIELPEWVGDGGRTVGVRVPDRPDSLDLLRATGPLAVTSANLSGDPPARSDTEARRIFGDRVDYYLPGTCQGGSASEVVDMTGPRPVILRPRAG